MHRMGMVGVLAILAVLPACEPLNGFSVVYESPELDLASIPESSILFVLPQEGPDISRLRLEQGDPRNVVEEIENRVTAAMTGVFPCNRGWQSEMRDWLQYHVA